MTDANLIKNPLLNHIDRAPYELGHLLQKIPADFSPNSIATPEEIQIVDAAICHAGNAIETVLCGLEAIGEMLFVATNNDKNEVNPQNLANIGCLIQHLAVEAQFLKGIKSNFEWTLDHHNKRLAASKIKGGGHA